MTTSPTRIAPIIDDMAASGGAMTETDLFKRVPGDSPGRKRHYLARWVRQGWLVMVGDTTYCPGPKALVGWTPKRSKPRAPREDLSGVEGSNEWLAIQQLAHGPLRAAGEGSVAEMLDVSGWKAVAVLKKLERFGHVRQLDESTWALRGQSEAAE